MFNKPKFIIPHYIKEHILRLNSARNSVRAITTALNAMSPTIPYTEYHVRKFLKKEQLENNVFIPPKPNPKPPIDSTTTYKILNLYDQRMPATEQELRSHRKVKRRKYTMRDLARKFNISQTTIHNIIHAKRKNADALRRNAMIHAVADKAKLKFKRDRYKRIYKNQMPRKRGPKPKIMTPEEFKALLKQQDPTNPNSCLLWQGPVDKLGYGRQRWGEEENTKYSMVTRIAATLADPPLIPNIYDPRRIKLTCGYPNCKICCNPAHMTVTTPVKQRSRIKNRISKKDAKFVLNIIKLRGLSEELKKELAEQFRVTEKIIDLVIEHPEFTK